MLPLLLLGSSALAAPLCPASAQEISAAIDDAERAFKNLNLAGLRGSVDDAVAEVACSTGPIQPLLAARLHRVEALKAFVDGNDAGARRALLAARVLDPTGDFELSVVPKGHPLRALDLAAAPASLAVVDVKQPASGLTYFDGHQVLKRPSDRPTVYQFVGPRGEVLQGAYVWPEEALAPYPNLAGATAEVTPKPKSMGPSVPLAIAGGAALVASGVSALVAAGAYADFHDTSRSDEQARADFETANTMQTVCLVTGVVGVGAGVGAVVVGRW